MAREKKFNFIPEAQLQEKVLKDRKPSVTISKSGQMTFSATALEEFGLVGRFIRLYGDPQKKALAWHIFDGQVGLEDLNLKKIEKNSAGVAQIGVGRLIKKMGVKVEGTLKSLPIQKYDDLMDNKTFFYVIVRDTSGDVVEEESIFSKRELKEMDKRNSH